MIIQSKRVYFEEKLQPRQIKIEEGIIKDVYPYGLFEVDKDYDNLIIMPGLIDIHNHGYNGGDANHANEEWLHKYVEYLPSEGVTSVLSGISTHPKDKLLVSLKQIGDFIDSEYEGTRILGVYEEGPFVSQTHKGAQDFNYHIVPDKKVIDEFNDACNGHLIYVMIAPEMLEGNYEVIDYCCSKNMKVALGHTGASFDVCKQAVEHGAISFTHTFNGMSGLHHRNPGVVGAAMYFDECYAELISDGVHVHYAAANALAKCKGKDKLIIITDSVAIKGLPIGKLETAERTTYICEDGVGRLENGTIAGSCGRLNHNLYYAINNEDIPLTTAFNAVTINPCRMLGINDRGLISKGLRADIAVFDDEFNNQATYIGGKLWAK